MDKKKHESVSQSDVKQCPFVDWYKFVRCRVCTCKNHTPVTPSRCLAIDRVRPDGTKLISDAEIHLFKFSGVKTSTRVVQIKRKKAIRRVKAIIALKRFVEYIEAQFGKSEAVFNTRTMCALEKQYPLNSPDVGWSNWMWEYFLDREIWEDFVDKKGRDGELGDIHLHNMLHIKLSRFERLLREFNQPSLKRESHENTDIATSGR